MTLQSTFIAFVFLAACSLFTVAADFNPNISNGTCYYKAGAQADQRYIPCGNAALGNVACCESQDMCLSSNACFNGQYYVTYVAGCTDESYDDESCPSKGSYTDQPFAGLVRCNLTDGSDPPNPTLPRIWMACKEPSSTTTVWIESPRTSTCTCPLTAIPVAFIDSSSLANRVSLPPSIGGSLNWQAGFGPSSTLSNSGSTPVITTEAPSSTTQLGGNLTGSNIMTSSVATQIASISLTSPSSTSLTSAVTTNGDSSNSNSTSLSSTSRASAVGIPVGVVLGSIVLLGIIGTTCRMWSRRRKQATEDQTHPYPGIGQHQPGEKIQQDFDDPRSPAWSGNKSELPADTASMVSPDSNEPEWARQQSPELEAGPARNSNMYLAMVSGPSRTSARTSATYIPYSRPISESVQPDPRPDATARRVPAGVHELPG